jgi:hypothetical protein
MSCRVSQIASYRSATPLLALLVSTSFIFGPVLLAEPLTSGVANTVKIECITPDGQLTEVPNTSTVDSRSPASIIDNATVDCALRAGETTFIIALPKDATRDGFTFVNENVTACGELKIAVSDSPLPADSPQWTKVDGIVPFAHKRLFKLSMLGVETRFVRLSFHVESPSVESTDSKAGRISSTFHSSALAEAINSHFVQAHSLRTDFAVSFGSVAPLPSTPTK